MEDRMTAVLQPHAPPNAHQPSECKETLARLLDDLLERYLDLLDDYEKLQQRLNRNLSNVDLI